MRSPLAAIALVIALAGVAAGCASPTPSGVPVTLEPSDASGPSPTVSTPSPTPSPTPTAPTPSPTASPTASPLPTLTPFSAPYPDEGWAVATAVDATRDVQRVIFYGSVKAGALLDFAYTCEQTTTISILVSDGRPSGSGNMLFRLEAPCTPGRIGRASAPSTSVTMPISLDVTVDPSVRFWVKLGVPADHLVR